MTGLGGLQKEGHVKGADSSEVVAGSIRRKVRRGEGGMGGDGLQRHTRSSWHLALEGWSRGD